MKTTVLSFLFTLLFIQVGVAQQSNEAQSLIKLSQDKWQWMSDKDVDKLKDLFDDNEIHKKCWSTHLHLFFRTYLLTQILTTKFQM